MTAVKQPVTEIIGRSPFTVYEKPIRLYGAMYTSDGTIPDYAWWDRFRRGKQPGFELAALFARPIVEIIVSSVMGEQLDVTLLDSNDPPEHQYTSDLLRRFMQRNRSLFRTMLHDLYSLGDQYIVINPDGSLSVPSPDTVEVLRDSLDYRAMLGYKITNKFKNATVTDEYYADRRVVTIKNLTSAALNTRFGIVLPNVTAQFEFANLLGEIPIVHFANGRSANETNGHPIYEALFRLFSRYDDLLEKALNGAEVLSDPVPVFSNADDPEAVKQEIGTATGEYNADGAEIYRLDLAALKAIITSANFDFKAPASFTGDIREMLKVLFLLMLEHTRIPEAVWGGELSSARASAGEQMKTFYMFIEGQRLALEGVGADSALGLSANGGLLQLIDLWLKVKALTDRRVVVGEAAIKWDALSAADETLKFNWGTYLHGVGVITDETAVEASGLVEDAGAEVAAAREEQSAKGDPFDAAMKNDVVADTEQDLPDLTNDEAA